jgi:hypothetical protein
VRPYHCRCRRRLRNLHRIALADCRRGTSHCHRRHSPTVAVEQVTADVVSVIQFALPLSMDSLNELIQQLQQLDLGQERILTALENIAADNEPPASPVAATVVTTGAGDEPAPVAVPVPPASPVAATVVTTGAGDSIEPIAVFHIGQRVYITNRINHVLVRRVTEADRTAIVTHFTASRVAIRTINGYHTHRHPKILHPL